MPKSPTHRKDAALRRFIRGSNLTLEQFQQAPPLSSILANLGTRKSVIDTLRFSPDPAVAAFLEVYDATPTCDRKQIPLEVIALKAKVDCNALLGAVVMSFRSIQAQKSALKAMAAHPKVVTSTILYAGMPGGERDRRMLHEAVGFLPTPKGLTINQNFGQPQDSDDSEHAESAPDVNDLFPIVNDKLEKWQAGRQKMLEGTN